MARSPRRTAGAVRDRLARGRAPSGTLTLLVIAAATATLWWTSRPSEAVPSLTASAWIDPATASVESLRLLPGIGPKLAERIDRVRREGAALERADDLLQVPGIGPRRVEALRPWLRRGGRDVPAEFVDRDADVDGTRERGATP